MNTTTTILEQEFRQHVDDIDPFVCSLDQLQALIDDAQSQYDQGYLAGIQAVRKQLEIVTGRSH